MSTGPIVTFRCGSPLGRLRGAATETGLAILGFPGSDFETPLRALAGDAAVTPVAEHRVVAELSAYFAGELRAFTVPLDLRIVPDFGRRVLEELCRVPFGELVTYGELARRSGSPGGARAVGRAVGANPIPIVVPCHRVVAAGGLLGGFSGGLPNKRRLLRLEGHSIDGDSDCDPARWSRSRVTQQRYFSFTFRR